MIEFLASTDPASLRFAIDLMVILATAALMAAVFQRFKLESIPGFLIAGVLVGPHVFGLVADSARIEQISGLAVIFLMFGIGLHLDLAGIRRGMVHTLGIGIVSTIGFIALSWAGLRALGMEGAPALLISMAVSISSTAVFVRIVSARKELRAVHGRIGLAISITQDILCVAILALVPVLSRLVTGPVATGDAEGSELPGWIEFIAAAGKGLGGVTVMLVVGRVMLPKLLNWVARSGSAELMLVVSASIALIAAVGTKLLGFSPEMGAFLGGLLLASTPYRFQLSGSLAPLRDLLMAIFFTAVGMTVDPRLLFDNIGVVLVAVTAVVLFKSMFIAITAWLAGVSAPSAFLTGVYMGNAGEFTIVIMGAAAAAGGLDGRQESLGVIVVILSLVASSLVIGPSHKLAARLRPVPMCSLLRGKGSIEGPTSEPDHMQISGHVIIAGFGPVGRALADRFQVLGIPYVVVELNTTTVERQAARGRLVIYGDITNHEVLESAGVHRADAVILSFPDDAVMFRACEAVRAMAPNAFIAARASFLSGAFRAQQLGADHVTVEEIATARDMEKEVLAKLQQRYNDRLSAEEAARNKAAAESAKASATAAGQSPA